MHTEPIHSSVTSLPSTTIKTDAISGGQNAPPSNSTLKGATKNGMRPKAAGAEVPLPVLSMTYNSKPVKLDAQSIQLSRRANRLPDFVDTPAFKELTGLIAITGGNTVPILVRLLSDNSHELVYGHRRLAACKLVGLKVNALVARGLSDEQAVRAMAHENTGRHDLSPLEKGRWYAQLREELVYKSDSALSRALGVDKSDVSNALALARLPVVIIDAFSSPHDLQYRFAKGLTDASKSQTIYARALAIADLRRLATSNLDGRAVYEMLHGKRQLQPAAARINATRFDAIPHATLDVLDETIDFPEKAVECPSVAVGESTVLIVKTNSSTELVVGPSNISCPILTQQLQENGVVILAGNPENLVSCLPTQAIEDKVTSGVNPAPKKSFVKAFNVWCPVFNAEANEVGAVIINQQGQVLIELNVGLSAQQCDLLASALEELLSHDAYKN